MIIVWTKQRAVFEKEHSRMEALHRVSATSVGVSTVRMVTGTVMVTGAC